MRIRNLLSIDNFAEYPSWLQARAALQRKALPLILLIQATLVPLHIFTTDYLDPTTRFTALSIGARLGAVAVFIFLAIGVWRWRWNPDIHAGVSFVINALSDAYVSSFANPDVLVTHLLGYGVVLIGYALLTLMPPILYTILMLVNTAGLALLLGTAPHLSPLEVLQKGGAFIIFFLAISPLLAWLRYAFAKSEYENARRLALINEELNVTNEELALSNTELQRISDELKVKLAEIEQKDKAIHESIEYARRIQLALLPSDIELESQLPNGFVLYMPCAVVSGDFYYYARPNEAVHLVAVGDATGHGVPGAFMSLIGLTLLNEVSKYASPDQPQKILEEIDLRLHHLLHEKSSVLRGTKVWDTIDLALVVIDEKNHRILFCGAKRPLYQVTPDNQISVYRGTARSLGEARMQVPFMVHELPFEGGYRYYLFTDGIVDQFGYAKLASGEEEIRKFMSRRLKALLLDISGQSPPQQKAAIQWAMEAWRRDIEQTDDICVIGFGR